MPGEVPAQAWQQPFPSLLPGGHLPRQQFLWAQPQVAAQYPTPCPFLYNSELQYVSFLPKTLLTVPSIVQWLASPREFSSFHSVTPTLPGMKGYSSLCLSPKVQGSP